MGTFFPRIASVLSLCVVAVAQAQTPKLSLLGSFRAGPYDKGAAEIVAHDAVSQRLFVVNGADRTIDILDMSDPTKLVRITQFQIPSEYGFSANSVAAKNGVIAIAVQAETKTDPGTCIFVDAEGRVLKAVTVGALPDMLTFTPNGKYVLVANEGEPSADYSVDPEGSVSVIDISGGIASLTQAKVRTAGFGQFPLPSLEPGVRIFGPNASVAQDLEPEYIAVSPDSKTAYVTLQENNAMGVLDVETATFQRIAALGVKPHWQAGNEIDSSDRDNEKSLRTWTVWGMYMPDGVASFTGPDNRLYLVTANEGDAREYDNFVEAGRVSTLKLDPAFYPNASELQQASWLGRLNVSKASGDLDGDGDYDMLFSFGARSISVWTADVQLAWDSHNQFEVLIAKERPESFNVSNTDQTVDSRSDDKGPEPEGVVIGVVNGKNYAFIGNERAGNIMIYDMTDPYSPKYVGMAWNRNMTAKTDTAEAGDLGPEGLIFIPAADSPVGKPLLVVANEISGTTTVWRID
ncbi:choice-of-anchor I family protein [Paludibaculum fermentans]|uniref:choice-of-anchor I family protein n=1 Tax=Paludibaculum fermentans TaxID=1473598 RepID=UPI003EB7459E